MPKVAIYNIEKKKVGELELAEEIFAAEISEPLMYEVLKAQLASKRSGSANTKGRSEVSGSTKKIYKQKGTGRARHGSIRAPIFVGGGQVFGPKPRSYAYRPTRKMRIGALRSALSLRLKEGRLTVVDQFELSEIKTKKANAILTKLDVGKGSLIVDKRANTQLTKSVSNLTKHHVLPPEGVNLYDLLRYPHLVVTKEAALALQERFKG